MKLYRDPLSDLTKWVPITQYMRPNGRKSLMYAPMPDEASIPKVKAILDAGLRFEAEVLTTNQVSMTVSSIEDDIAIEISANDDSITAAFKRLIDKAFDRIPKP